MKKSERNFLTKQSEIKDRTAELKSTIRLLNKEIAYRKQVEETLRNSEKRFRAVAFSTSDLIWEGDVRDGSLNWFGDIDGILGYEPGMFPRTIKGLMENIHPEDQKPLLNAVQKAVENGGGFFYEYRIRCFDGTYRYWSERGKAIGYEDGKAVRWIGTATDITENKKYEEKLLAEIKERRRITDILRDAKKRLKDHALELEQSNTALKVLLKQREIEKKELEKNIVSNIKHLILPYVMNLRKSRHMSKELVYINKIETNLKRLVSPFSHKLSSELLRLTPKEIQIADFIKDGKQDKDIVEAMNVSLDTVKTHRKNIRRKLGIYGKRINLRVKLLSLIE